ncbi:hypothetical protein AADV15_000363 [Campylobacter coli]
MKFSEYLMNGEFINESSQSFPLHSYVSAENAMKSIQADGEFDKNELTHVEKSCKDIYLIVKSLCEIDEQLGIILHTLSTMKNDKYLDSFASGTDFDIKDVKKDIIKIDDAVIKLSESKIKDIAKRLHIVK